MQQLADSFHQFRMDVSCLSPQGETERGDFDLFEILGEVHGAVRNSSSSKGYH